jgi:predicted dehydrogenase
MAGSSSEFRVAFVGTGGIAGAHASAAEASGGAVKVVAAVDTNAEALAKFTEKWGVPGFASFDALLKAIDSKSIGVDGIVLCTPPSYRLEPVQKAAERGLAVLIEKPLARTGAEARQVAEVAKKHPKACVALGYCHRFAPAVVEMKRLVAAGKIGTLTRFENAFAFHHPPMSERWFSDPAVSGGGSFIDTGCHSLDLFHFLVGRPKTLAAVFHKAWPGRGESEATALVAATDGSHKGTAGVILAGWMEPERFTVDLIGTGGSLHYDYMKAEELVYRPSLGASETMKVETHEVRFAKQLTGWAKAARSGGGREAWGNLAGVDEGVAAAEAVDGAIQASKIL